MPKPKLLIAICSYGEKNLKLLKQIIQTYQSMTTIDVDVVVLSEAPKDLGPDIRVLVGLPSPNPWSLPFGHKELFAKSVDQYDLFAYSEDDMEVTEKNILSFVNATPQLADDEIAGFLRYEVNTAGHWMVSEAWGHFHWKPESIRRRGNYTVAEFSNEHAAFYLLTQSQLRKAIASGGFVRAPYEGRYDMLCCAATDPYTSCGFRKVICISAIEDFLVHHMSNRYADGLPVSLPAFKEQIRTLMDIDRGAHSASTLCPMESKIARSWWEKSYFEKPREEALELVPADARSVLSIGCGWGATEARLKERGATVTALPLDSIVGAISERRGVEVIYGTWASSSEQLEGRRFSCVLIPDMLHLQRDPLALLQQCAQWVDTGGTLVLAGPNFDRIPWRIKRAFGVGEFGKLRSFEQSGISVCGPATLTKPLVEEGFDITAIQWLHHASQSRFVPGGKLELGGLTARDWVLQARRIKSAARPARAAATSPSPEYLSRQG